MIESDAFISFLFRIGMGLAGSQECQELLALIPLSFCRGALVNPKEAVAMRLLLQQRTFLELYLAGPWHISDGKASGKLAGIQRVSEESTAKSVALYEQMQKMVKFASSRVYFLIDDSLSVIEQVFDLSLDFVYIDEQLESKQLAICLHRWASKVKPNGFICGPRASSSSLRVPELQSLAKNAGFSFQLLTDDFATNIWVAQYKRDL